MHPFKPVEPKICQRRDQSPQPRCTWSNDKETALNRLEACSGRYGRLIEKLSEILPEIDAGVQSVVNGDASTSLRFKKKNFIYYLILLTTNWLTNQ